jgi:hypothetical protein
MDANEGVMELNTLMDWQDDAGLMQIVLPSEPIMIRHSNDVERRRFPLQWHRRQKSTAIDAAGAYPLQTSYVLFLTLYFHSRSL